MPIKKYRWFARSMQPFSVNQGVALSGNHFDLFESSTMEMGSDQFGSLAHILAVIWKGADAGDTEQCKQVIEEALLVRFGIAMRCLRIGGR
jgi:hypothetical protein